MANIMIVEDTIDLCQALADVMRKQGHKAKTAFSGSDAFEIMQREVIDLVLLDINLPDANGIDLLSRFKEYDPEILVIMITALTDAQPAIEAMKKGAYDYLLKPFELDELKLIVAKALETHRLRREVTLLKDEQKNRLPVHELFGESLAIKEVQRLIAIVSQTPKTSVLIQGESGTGKELVANGIHKNSLRADKPFIAINCAAIPENLLESELFGYEKGAFTDAKNMKKGLFEQADGGSIFLDEVSSMKMALQPKILRVLETSTFRRIGGNMDIHIDVRIIAATNRDLEECVRDGIFREDLMYRLKVFGIKTPPLREHKEDILPLTKRFIEAHNKEFNKSIRGLTPDAERMLINYEWPGNVRELKNVVERSIILCNGNLIRPEHMYLETRPGMITTPEKVAEPATQVPEKDADLLSLEDMEKKYILRILKHCGNNKSKTARILNISRSTLREKLKMYGIA